MESGGICPLTGTGDCDAYLECLLPDQELGAKAKQYIDSILVKPKNHPARECGDIDSPLFSRGWEIGEWKDRKQNRKIWISPVRKIEFLLHKDALEFDALVQFHGNEFVAWDAYSDAKKVGESRRVRNSKVYDTDVNLETYGWIKGFKRSRRIWLSPEYKIPFLWQKVAVEFHQHCQDFRDEAEAIEDFVKGKNKVSDFILGGSYSVKGHIRGEVDVNNLDSLASVLGAKFHSASSRRLGMKYKVNKRSKRFNTRKKRETLVFDLEVAKPPPTIKPRTNVRKAAEKSKKVAAAKRTRTSKRRVGQKCVTVAEVKVVTRIKEDRKLRQKRELSELSASVIGHLKLNGE
jgi:hypothetical protein